MTTKTKITLAAAIAGGLLMLSACDSGDARQAAKAEYTEQTARAIIDSGWKIAGSIIIAAIVRAIANK